MKRQFTVSVFVTDGLKTLLIRHRKYGKWLQPGGHLEENEIPTEAAIREVLEETGITVELVAQEPFIIDEPHAKTLVRPFVCLLEEIPAHAKEPVHQHIDLIYLGRPTDREQTIAQEHCCWFDLSELEQLHREGVLFPEILDIAKHVLAPSHMR